MTPEPHGPAHRRGTFIALEGGDGVGKTTHARLLARHLMALAPGLEVLLTREPGGTPEGRRIRSIVLDPGTDLDVRAEALLFAADRAQHVARVVEPALARGAVVVSDRYVDSGYAYQGAGRSDDYGTVRRVTDWATRHLVPDLTILLDLDEGAARARQQARDHGASDRMEAVDDAFRAAVRSEFRRLATAAPERYAVIDAGRTVDQVAADVLAAVLGRTSAAAARH